MNASIAGLVTSDCSLLRIGARNLVDLLAFSRQMVQIAAKEDEAGLGKPRQQHLMPRRVAWRELDDHAPIAEDVVIGVVDHRRLAVLQCAVEARIGKPWWRIGEHGVAFGFLHEPRGRSKVVGVGGVVVVVVRQGEIRDAIGRVANLGQLGLERLGDLGPPDIRQELLRRSSGFNETVGQRARIPQQRAAWMHEQVHRDRQRRRATQVSAVEDVHTQR